MGQRIKEKRCKGEQSKEKTKGSGGDEHVARRRVKQKGEKKKG